MLNAVLKIVGGKQDGKLVPLPTKKFLIGREQDCHLRPSSDSVSRHHCVITIDDYCVRVRDLGSSNGTYLNGTRIMGVQEAKPGDHLRIGSLEFEIQFQAEGAPVEVGAGNNTTFSLDEFDLDQAPDADAEETAVLGGDTALMTPAAPTETIEIPQGGIDPSATPPTPQPAAEHTPAAEPPAAEQPPAVAPEPVAPATPPAMDPAAQQMAAQQQAQQQQMGMAPGMPGYPQQPIPGYGMPQPQPGYPYGMPQPGMAPGMYPPQPGYPPMQPQYGAPYPQPGYPQAMPPGYPAQPAAPAPVPAANPAPVEEEYDDDEYEDGVEEPAVVLPPPEETGLKEEKKVDDGGAAAPPAPNPAADILKKMSERR